MACGGSLVAPLHMAPRDRLSTYIDSSQWYRKICSHCGRLLRCNLHGCNRALHIALAWHSQVSSGGLSDTALTLVASYIVTPGLRTARSAGELVSDWVCKKGQNHACAPQRCTPAGSHGMSDCIAPSRGHPCDLFRVLTRFAAGRAGRASPWSQGRVCSPACAVANHRRYGGARKKNFKQNSVARHWARDWRGDWRALQLVRASPVPSVVRVKRIFHGIAGDTEIT